MRKVTIISGETKRVYVPRNMAVNKHFVVAKKRAKSFRCQSHYARCGEGSQPSIAKRITQSWKKEKKKKKKKGKKKEDEGERGGKREVGKKQLAALQAERLQSFECFE